MNAQRKIIFPNILLALLCMMWTHSFADTKNKETITSYQIRKAKEKVEHLRGMNALSIESGSNESLGTNTLTARSSRLSAMLADDAFSARDKLLLDHMDAIATDLLKQNRSVICANIVTHANAMSLGMTTAECESLNQRITAFYNTGVYSVSIPQGTILETNRTKANINTQADNKNLFSKIKKQTYYDSQLIEKISYLSTSGLQALCKKLLDSNSQTLNSKEQIANAIEARSNQLGIANCAAAYIHKTHANTISYTTPSTGGSKDPVLLAEIANLTSQINAINTTIASITAQITANAAIEPPKNSPKWKTWKKTQDALNAQLATEQTKLTPLQAELEAKQREYNGS